VTVFGHQDGPEVGYNPRYRGKSSYNPLLSMEANSSYLWDAELRRGNAGTWDGSIELMNLCFANVPRDIRELRVRADAGFGLNPVFDTLESWPADYAVVARLIPALKRLLPGLHYTLSVLKIRLLRKISNLQEPAFRSTASCKLGP